MDTFSTIQKAKDCILNLKKGGKTIGFVPTMGALHKGHTSLLERAEKENDISVSSIFVNPLQFNDKKDLEKYPRTLEKDIEKLKSAHCDVLFAPSPEEMYGKQPEARSQKIEAFLDLGVLDKIMEGKHRPGHFQGVCVVVKKLFDIIEPNKAYFGEKDFQQLAIIKHMVKTLKLPVEIVSCPTVREADGLAMSSRNTLLTTDERKNSAHIYAILQKAKEKWKGGRMEEQVSNLPSFQHSVAVLKNWVTEKINGNPFLQLEYFEVVNAETLQSITDNQSPLPTLRACIAVKAGAVRLIDNISL